LVLSNNSLWYFSKPISIATFLLQQHNTSSAEENMKVVIFLCSLATLLVLGFGENKQELPTGKEYRYLFYVVWF